MPDHAPAGEALAAAVLRVTTARDASLASMPMPRILAAIDRAVLRWLDPAYPLRTQAERKLPGVTGYSPEMVHECLPLLLEPFRRIGLEAMLLTEFGGLEAPTGPRLITHILAGNIPSIGPESIIRALLMRAASIVKPATGDPLMPSLFAKSLMEADVEIGACVGVLPWQGGRQDLESQAFAASGAIIAYGGQEAIESLRRLAPPSVPFIEHGQRISFAAVAREALQPEGLRALAAQAAWDISFFDQQGCVSPQAIFVEDGGVIAPMEFAQALAEAMTAVELRLPRGRLSAGETAAIQQVRGTWEMRSAAGHPVAMLHSSASTAWTILYEQGARLEPTCLNRTVRVIAWDSLDRLPDALGAHARYLQTAGIAASQSRMSTLRPMLQAVGVTRICELGRMQQPPADWLHDGRHPLRELAGIQPLPNGKSSSLTLQAYGVA